MSEVQNGLSAIQLSILRIQDSDVIKNRIVRLKGIEPSPQIRILSLKMIAPRFNANFLFRKIHYFYGLVVFLSNGNIHAQHGLMVSQLLGQTNTAPTALPFLMISPDARAGGLGDAGGASSPDANSIYWNASKLPFIDNKMGVSISYTPWLRALVPDINLTSFSIYWKFKGNQVIAASMRYFSLGDVSLISPPATKLSFRPKEMAYDLAYSRRFGEHFSTGITGRYIYSNFTNEGKAFTGTSHPVETLAVDFSAFYHNDKIKLAGKNSVISLGINVSNVGAKVTYADSSSKDFMPTNMRLGGAFLIDLNRRNSISLIADFNKLLIPNQQQNNICGGIEYWLDQICAIRTGYFYENSRAGNRKYYTVGMGLKYYACGLDIAYLVPLDERSPLQDTMRIALWCNFN